MDKHSLFLLHSKGKTIKKKKEVDPLKKFLAILLVISLIMIPFGSAFAASDRTYESYFPVDIQEHWAYDHLNNLVDADILTGYVGNNQVVYLNPEQSITRAEFAAIIVRALDLKQGTSQTKSFIDVPSSHWAHNVIKVASSNGIINGLSDTHFSPDSRIKREEAAAMIYRAFKDTVSFTGNPVSFSDVTTGHWSTEYIRKVSGAGIIEGYQGKFSPANNAKRAEAAVMLSRALNKEVSNLPSDEQLTSAVLSVENAGLQLLFKQDLKGLLDHNARNYTGFHKALADYTVEFVEETLDEGFELSFDHKQTLSATVISKTNRFAIVDLKGATVSVTAYHPEDDFSYTVTESADGLVYLKKVGNTWKIYSVEQALFQ